MGFINTLTKVLNGLAANDGTGQTLRSGADTINANWDLIASAVNALAASQGSSVKPFDTKADLVAAQSTLPAGTVAVVYADPTPANNTSYIWNGTTLTTAYDRLTYALGNGSGFQQVGTGANIRDVQDKLRDAISVLDFMTSTEKTDCKSSAPTMDHSTSVQAALDAAAAAGVAIIFPPFRYNLHNVRLTPRTDAWHVFAHGATIFNTATASTDDCCLYISALTSPGSANETYTYSSGLRIYGATFKGANGYGVGLKIALAGEIVDYGCNYVDLTDGGLKSMGCAGLRKYGGAFAYTKTTGYCAYFPKLASDSFTSGYTSSTSAWNDGVLFSGVKFAGGAYSVWYGGSASEGVIRFDSCIFTAAYTNFIYANSPWRGISFVNCWCEYFYGTVSNSMFRFTDDSYTGGTYESLGAVVFESCHITTAAAFKYAIECEARRLVVRNSEFQIRTTSYVGCIYFAGGSSGKWVTPTDVTPYGSNSAQMATGVIGLKVSDVEALGTDGGRYTNLYATINGGSYLLQWRSNQTATDGTLFNNYNVLSYQRILPAQDAMSGVGLTSQTLQSKQYCSQILVGSAVTSITTLPDTVTIEPMLNGLTLDQGVCTLDTITVTGVTEGRLYASSGYGYRDFRDVRTSA